MNVTSYSANGVKASQKLTLNKDIFDLELKNHELVNSAYKAYLSNGRENLAVTKTRGLVRGGGKKPYRQKGTGRARFGSTRNPIWRSGGIAFGPTGKENYSVKLNLKARRLAVKQALTLAAGSSKVSVIEDIKLKAAKTKELTKLIDKIGLSGQLLIVVDKIADELSLASRNIPNIIISTSSGLNVFNILNSDHILLTKLALDQLTKRLEAK